ncbi:hypothetical protein GCM10007989_31760 [Devosia pacifica]|uniref:Flavin reductase like domain-containing protein n=1 Tax=Devosia pacifica TaxID=1335967 RepID=A0A918VVH7_9HYPH|nr:flavin reductase family protein [Devosia pacifica]GHA33231.1 hypothetical protein GCM10007989_31760 [Devosia pacifica]
MSGTLAPVDPARAHRLINHGPTVLISSTHSGVDNVMPAAWATVLDMAPAKVVVVIDRATKTRELVDASGRFVLQVPVVAQLALVDFLGMHSAQDEPDKLDRAGATLFRMPGHDLPFVADCAGWMACRVLTEPSKPETYDLVLAEVEAAWSDPRMFRDGRWVTDAPPDYRTLHHVSGGRYFAIGETIDVDRSPDEGPGN